ncbi:mycofactocin biosynthesis peptidyl-dipeptidase MftE [Kineosporia sp. R_H_3]|uniref:mycofactocin biosynthesis peptidyl-dipeptidase MftE n=1 Tax=Kineosporia sp. R_H_3 TaxID=1961848 RepID=UPI000B4A9527|nr:mycofactocin biosynthesis peptidyl-dipeptidase MftE [Kineosporia sp. R_H_3]
MRLTDALSPDVEAAARGALVVPLGSLEQHGPHLPLATDTLVASAVAERLAAVRPGAALAPAVPFGASGEHAGFAGTVSIGTQALRLLLVELLRDVTSTWPAVLLVNGHGGNAEAVAGAVRLGLGEGRAVAAVHLGLPGMDAHAGRSETSLLLHLAPHLVALERAEPGPTAPVADLLPRLRAEGVRGVSPNGVLGDPTGATAAEGERLLAGLVERAVEAYDRLVEGG